MFWRNSVFLTLTVLVVVSARTGRLLQSAICYRMSRKRKADDNSHKDATFDAEQKDDVTQNPKIIGPSVKETFVSMHVCDDLIRKLHGKSIGSSFRDTENKETRLPSTLKALKQLGVLNVRAAACQLLQWTDFGVDSEQAASRWIRDTKTRKKQHRQQLAKTRQDSRDRAVRESAEQADYKAQLDADWHCLLPHVRPGWVTQAWVRFPISCDEIPDWDGPPQPRFNYSYSPVRVRLTSVRLGLGFLHDDQVDIELLEPFAASFDLNFCNGTYI